MRYAEQFCPKSSIIKLKRDQLTVDGIKQMYIDCPGEEGKYDILVHLYGLMTVGSSIIFVKVGKPPYLSDIFNTSTET